MLRTDRLETVAAELVRVIEATPLPADAIPAELRPVLSVARRLGLDVEQTVRRMAAASLRSGASRASADPARADELAGWLAHLLAWLRDERDDPPPADIPIL